MSKSKAPSPIRKADYEAIEDALLQSARGRWFLAEYSSRNRSADTRMLLDAISRLESTMLAPKPESPADRSLRHELIEMSEAIAQTRKEIAAMRYSDQDESQLTNATEELDAIVEATEKATSDILEAAEDIQEAAWQMREQGLDPDTCDRLDARATDIYTACSFQDLTGQRTSKVVQVLSYLENRVATMIDIWGLDDIEIRPGTENDNRPDAHLLNGPARRGEGIGQDDVDQMLQPAQEIEPEPANPSPTEALLHDPVMAPPASVTQPEPSRSTGEENGASEAAGNGHSGPFANDLLPEVVAEDFEPPAQLGPGDLDEPKKQALFS